MKLRALLTPLQSFGSSGSLDVEITGLSCDSRRTVKGHLFFALPGTHAHGKQFLPQAETAGAAAVLSDQRLPTTLPCVVAENPRRAMAQIANVFHDFPSSKLWLFSVTGTNGKTTCTFLLRSVLEAASFRCGLVGTVQNVGPGFDTASKLTTPDSPELQQLLSAMVSDGWETCAMEISSHSLSQYRAGGCTFVASIFTNLTQDHLDYHGTMEDYFEAKLMLFRDESCETKNAIVNGDDPYGKRIVEIRRRMGHPVFTYGFQEGADFRILSWTSRGDGSEMTIGHRGDTVQIRTPLIATYNAYNIAGVFGAAAVTGVEPRVIASGIEHLRQIPGRLERIEMGQDFLILIDYAHTEDAMRQLLTTVRPYTHGRLIVLFGCGGERDRGKRPMMGQVAGELSDIVILTSDNPRSEDPLAILREVRQGVDRTGNRSVHEALDRRDAIALAVSLARAGDTLVLAGKGHEDYQIIGSEKQHFNEREVLAEFLTTKATRRQG